MALGEELRRLRRSRGLTQADLAELSGMSVEGVSLLERGRRTPRISTLVLLAEAMELDESERSSWLRVPDAGGSAPPPVPTWVGDLVGRDGDVAAVSELLDTGSRLVTLTGPGGVGKTRCAAAVAERASAGRPDGVVWIRMATLRDPQAWWDGIAEAFGVRCGGSVESLAANVAGREMLVVCDNAEHVLDRCRHLVVALVSRTPGLQFLVTSRRRLRIPGERSHALLPLAVACRPQTEQDLRAAPATELFLRVADRPPGRSMSLADVDAVHRICAQVDGLPLAIEVVARRTDIMGLPELAAAVSTSLADDRFVRLAEPDDLTSTLAEGVVGWSREVLRPDERDIVSRLSVFAAAFSQADAQQLLGISAADTAAGLSTLVATSLLVRAPDLDGQAMFRMLSVVRAVAARELAGRGETDLVRRRHTELVAAKLAGADPQLAGESADAILRALDASAEDVDAAMAWAALNDPLLALRVAGSVWRWCYLRGRYAQGRAWAREALAAAAGLNEDDRLHQLRARALGVSGGLAFLECDYENAYPAVDAARALFHAGGERSAEAWALGRLGAICRERAQYVAARAWHRQALAILEDLAEEPTPDNPAALSLAEQLNALVLVEWLAGDIDSAVTEAGRAQRAAARLPEGEVTVWAAMNRGVIARLQGRLGEADALLRRAQDISERHDFPEGIAWSLNQRGVIARLRGDEQRARRMQQAALIEHRRLGDRWRQASSAEELALLAALAGDVDEAADRLAEATGLREQIGAPVPTAEQDVLDRTLELLGA
ncbi:MAG: helix-turn-helix domain-containing protein [Tetrasphaera sp.]